MVAKANVAGLLVLIAGASAMFAGACGGRQKAKQEREHTIKEALKEKEEQSLCGDWKGNPDMEAEEIIGMGSAVPNIRRVYQIYQGLGDGGAQRKILVCREIDTNLDGVKDIVRTYNQNGDPTLEKVDTNYDGKIDVWRSFVNGQLVEEQIDRNGDGKPDEWRIYEDGVLAFVHKDRNGDGKPDEWQFFNNGKLERIGFDDSFEGRVTRWIRNEEELPSVASSQGTDQQADGGTGMDVSAADAAAGDGGPASTGPTDAGGKGQQAAAS
ncbi:hypothetical protein [Pajaroellobacter abortibovis]|uniref:Lipoprotein n=1 Tax=Pajaroellobacter abortibovis TaxID=1882918 RepID=A0A1L6MVR2_9BACT|nr:hypothetical protein [Pajaroellobacter abortibovis]APR99629.1 hypothetical protein BCY86_02265 [Pajaroellobacter abortibovis]